MRTRTTHMLNTSQLDEAEKQFLFLYQQMQEKSEDTTKFLVQTLNLDKKIIFSENEKEIF
jgi:hypothetical protein